MALKDVIQKIPLSLREVGTTSYTPHIDLPLIAESLGLNFDSDTNVMYMGDNPKNGFEFYLSGTTLYIYLYCDGVRKSSNYDYKKTSCNTAYSCLYYIKCKNAVVFGINDASNVNLQFIVGKGKNLVDNTEKFGYFLSPPGDYDTQVGGAYVISDGYYKAAWFSSSGLLQMSDYFVHAKNMCTHQGDIFESIYVAEMFKQTLDFQLFTMNTKNYVALSAKKNNAIRYIAEF